jgi:hypothetical protein
MMAEIWKHRKEILEGAVNLALKNQAVELIAEDRMVICHSCPKKQMHCKNFPAVKNCCGECGCVLTVKTRSLKSSCPLGKWPAML